MIIDDAKQLTEFAELALSGKLRNHGRTDADMDERAGAHIADKLNLTIPMTWDGRALCGLLGSLERHGMTETDLRHFAEQRLEEITPEQRPDPVFTSAPTITEEDKADLEAIVDSPATSKIVRELVSEELSKSKSKKPLTKKAPTREQRLTALAQALPRYKRNG
jgi:hypothetical protein